MSKPKKVWNRARNPFLLATKNSFIMALDMSIYHYIKLKQKKDESAFYMTMFLAYEIVHNLYVAAYNKWIGQGGTQVGNTQIFTESLVEMKTNVDDWDYRITKVYPQGSAKYKMLFPQAHRPFMRGKESTRVEAVITLSNQIGTDAALAAVKADIDVYYAELKAAFTEKDVQKENTGTDSGDLETMRVVMCEDMLGDYGGLITLFKRSPADVEQFFDMTIVRDHIQNHFTKLLNPLKVYVITQRKLADDVMIKFSNPGTTIIRFYRSDDKMGLPTRIYVEVLPGDTLIRANSSLDIGKYILCYNTDAVNKGDMDIVFP